VSGDPISSTKFNTLVQDLEADANTDRPIVAGGTGASTALAARANLGLEIGVNVQAFDAGLLSIAGLTTLADRSIYTTASDTYAVYTLTAAGRAILDDADAAAQRTTLGLGTAATVNTGTSGATIPLLDAANTFGTTQVISLTNAGGSAQGLRVANTSGAASSSATISLDPGNNGFGDRDVLLRATNNGSNQITFSILQANAGAPGTTLSITSAGVATMLGNTMWHAGNDGAGSGLDADTLDGVQGSAFAQMGVSNTFTQRQVFSGLGTSNASGFLGIRALRTSGQVNGIMITGLTVADPMLYSPVGTDDLAIGFDTGSGPVNVTTFFENGLVQVSGTLRARTDASTETTGTLTVASANRTIQATGDITIPNAVFAAGDIILIYAGASARTITEGSSVTMRLGGTATTGSRTLAARGVAVLFFVSSSEVVVSGGAVT
jgi:hypothetical protein